MKFIADATSPQIQVYKKKWAELYTGLEIPAPSQSEFRTYMKHDEESVVKAESYAVRYRSEIDGKAYSVSVGTKTNKWLYIAIFSLLVLTIAHGFIPVHEPEGNRCVPYEYRESIYNEESSLTSRECMILPHTYIRFNVFHLIVMGVVLVLAYLSESTEKIYYSFGKTLWIYGEEPAWVFNILTNHVIVKFGANISCYTKRWDGVC